CVGAQTSQRSALTLAVQFIGSIVACARNGFSYVAATLRFALSLTASDSPPWTGVAHGPRASAACIALRMAAELRPAFGPGSNSSGIAASAVRACQYVSATTATPLGIGTTARAPGIALMAFSS